jgi:protein gp37
MAGALDHECRCRTESAAKHEDRTMGISSRIEWTEATWNPVRGCTKLSEGCKHCYAEVFAERFRGVKGNPYEHGFDLRLVPEMLERPRSWRKARLIFVNSMSDVFHEKVPEAYVRKIFDVMASTPQHTFQVLTKRSERLAEMAPRLPWPTNVWMGVTVESLQYVNRIDHLRKVPAALRFISAEPLLSQVELDLNGIGWVIVGGESGGGFRAMDPAWARSVRDQCLAAGVPFFFKQWSGFKPKAQGSLLEGREWKETPTAHPGAIAVEANS